MLVRPAMKGLFRLKPKNRISYNRYNSVPKSFICCCSRRDSCMLTSRCMLPWLRSAPYPAQCPCEPLRPVGDMQDVSYGARSRQYSPLLPASSSQPRSIVERRRSGPMCRVHIYSNTSTKKKKMNTYFVATFSRYLVCIFPACIPS